MANLYSRGPYIGWIAGAIAVIASLLLLIDVIAHHRGQTVHGMFGPATPAAAGIAVASVRPKPPQVLDRRRS